MAKYGHINRPVPAWRDGKLAAWAGAGLRIGIFGGSFNPAHGGHFHAAMVGMKALRLDRVVWLVSPQNPLKQLKGMADYERRFASACHIANHPHMTVSGFEAQHGLQFSVDTVCALKTKFPNACFVWLLGADSWMSLDVWKDWRKLVESVPIAIVARPNAALAATRARAAQVFSGAKVSSSMAMLLADLAPPAWVYLATELDKRSASEVRQMGLWP
jgi:nicotinate-nucleotide adenylyltransferase